MPVIEVPKSVKSAKPEKSSKNFTKPVKGKRGEPISITIPEEEEEYEDVIDCTFSDLYITLDGDLYMDYQIMEEWFFTTYSNVVSDPKYIHIPIKFASLLIVNSIYKIEKVNGETYYYKYSDDLKNFYAYGDRLKSTDVVGFEFYEATETIFGEKYIMFGEYNKIAYDSIMGEIRTVLCCEF